ncbi:MAG: molybdopterin-dependent oxidoreductase, partial [Candidatus Korarchaeota archaeon]|nr:molybdopterin-dependent oxidoreductase [Candidatus Korarchaeota archaeon]
FQALAERLEQYSPQWASQVCDVPAELVEKVAREFGTIRPAVIDPGWHDPKYENSVQTWRMAAVLNAMVGNIDKPGGLVFNAVGRNVTSSPLPESRVDVQWMKEKGIIVSTAQPHILAYIEAILTGKPYPIKALMVWGGNWIRTVPDEDKVKAAFKKLEHVIVVDNMATDTAMYADVILPDTTYLERDDPLFGVAFTPDKAMYSAFKVIDPIYDARPLIDIAVSIADKMGMKEKYFHALAVILGMGEDKAPVLQQAYEAEGIAGIRKLQAKGKGIDLGELQSKGVVLLTPREKLIGTMPYKKPLQTPTGKVEIYSMKLLGITSKAGKNPNWDPLPDWVPPRVFNKASGNVFYLTYGRSPVTSHTHTSDNDLLISIARKGHYGLWINAKRAAELGIKDGDLVKVTSLATGKSATAVAFVTEGVRPDTVFTVSGWGIESDRLTNAKRVGGVPMNRMWKIFEDQYKLLPNALMQEILVRVEKA